MRMLVVLGLAVLALHGSAVEAARRGPAAGAPPPHAVGARVPHLPSGNVRLELRDRRLFYYGGAFYEPRRPGFVIVPPPLGVHVPMLPPGYISFGIGLRHYFFVNSIYYVWAPGTRDYVVVDEPEGAADAMSAQRGSGSAEVFAYPNEGQSEEQARRDRYECHLWAAEQSGYDPTYSDARATPTSQDDYRRAMTACLVGRGYVVR